MLEIRLVVAAVGRSVTVTKKKRTLRHEKTFWGDGNLLYLDLNMSLDINASIKYIFHQKALSKMYMNMLHQGKNYFH